jgi:hypothetical protein
MGHPICQAEEIDSLPEPSFARPPKIQRVAEATLCSTDKDVLIKRSFADNPTGDRKAAMRDAEMADDRRRGLESVSHWKIANITFSGSR